MGLLTIEIDGWDTNIAIYNPNASKSHKEFMGLNIFTNGATTIQEKELKSSITIYIFIYKGCNHAYLFHIIGHELQHATHMLSGQFYEWEGNWGSNAAKAYSEYLAYKWNYNQALKTGFSYGKENWYNQMKKYLSLWQGYLKRGVII